MLEMTGMIGIIANEAGIGRKTIVRSVSSVGTIPVPTLVPIRSAIPSRIARAIFTITFVRMMVAEAELRVIVGMVITVGRALRVA